MVGLLPWGSVIGAIPPVHVDTYFVCYYYRVVKNVTVTLPEDVAQWLRVRAAQNSRSVSKWLADLVEGMKRQEDEYDLAMERALAIRPEKLNESGQPYPSRDSLYDRPNLR